RIPHERAVRSLHRGDPTREAGRCRLGTDAVETAEDVRDAFVLEVTGHLSREVRLHHPVNAKRLHVRPPEFDPRSSHYLGCAETATSRKHLAAITCALRALRAGVRSDRVL